MFKPTLKQKILHKIIKSKSPFLIAIRKLFIKNTDFTIISNNCWGGCIYEYYGLKKNSPTIGSWFFAEDYIKFISNLKYYLSINIVIKKAEESKYYEKLKKMGSDNCVIGVLDDIEIIMLHYHDSKIAEEKWNRRIKRVNFDNLIIKFSKMNDCSDDLIEKFEMVDFDKISRHCRKIVFVNRPMKNIKSAIYLKGQEKLPELVNDTYVFNQGFSLHKLINS